MFMPPNSRYRLYGARMSYPRLLGHLLFGNFNGTRKDVEALEREVEKDLGRKHALALMHARNGVYLGVKHSITPDKNEVILSPYTIVEVVNMVIVAGGVPVFADVVPHTCNIDPDSIEPLITDRTAAVIVTHLHGLLSDVERIREICDRHGLKLFEDAAQAYGARIGDTKAGAFGDAGMFSFGMMKNINSFHGGMLVTDDTDLYEKAKAENAQWDVMPKSNVFKRMLQGGFLSAATLPAAFKSFTYWLFRYGYLNDVDALMRWSRSENNPVRQTEMPEKYKWQTPNILARFTREQLPNVDAEYRKRLEIARIYHEGLKDVAEIETPPWREDGSHTYMSYPIVIDDRVSLMKYLLRHGRDVAMQHMRNCADLDVFDQYRRDVPGAERTANSILLLPTYPRYGKAEARKTVALVRKYFESRDTVEATQLPEAALAAE